MNEEFGWRDPNNANRNPEPVGPGWLERKHRSAMRSGVIELREDPQLFILDQVKRLANRLGSSSVLNFALNLVPTLMDFGHRLGPLHDGRLTVKSKSGSARIVFKGGVLGGRSRGVKPVEGEPKRQTFDRLWRRMAATNAGLYRIPEARHDAPEIGRRRPDDPYALPLHHPGSEPLEEGRAPKETTVGAMLATVLSRVARGLHRNRSAILAAKSLISFHQQVELLTSKIEAIFQCQTTKRTPTS